MPEAAQAIALKFNSETSEVSHDAAALVRHLAHELRQGLSTAESIAYYMQMVTPRHDTRTHQQLEKLQQLVDQMNWILTDAVHLVQAVPPAVQIMDLNELLTEAIAGMAGWRADIESGEALVRLDPAQARHLLKSLLSCFAQLARGREPLVLRSSRRNQEVCLEVRAPGVNLRLEELESMFDPFSSELPRGPGMSLATARGIVQGAGGRLEAHSEPARGTWVEAAFPAA